MKILVTGGSAFIGGHIVDGLRAAGRDVISLVAGTAESARFRDRAGVEERTADFLSPDTLTSALAGIDTVVHAAGLLNSYDWHNYYLENFLATKNLIRACAESAAVTRFIFLSSFSACGPSAGDDPLNENSRPSPVSHLGKSKLLAEEEVLKYIGRLQVSVLRPTVVYGPRDTSLLALFRFAGRGLFPIAGNREKVVNICHIDDIVAGVNAVIGARPCSGELFFIGGENHTVASVKSSFECAAGRPLREVVIPPSMLPVVSLAGECAGRLLKKPFILNRDRLHDLRPRNWAVTIEKSRRELGYEPKVGLAEGISGTFAWYRNKGWVS